MLEVFFVIIIVTFLFAISSIIEDISEEMNTIKREVDNDYKYFINACKVNPKLLNWVSTLNEKFESFMSTKEYKTIKPYDKFRLSLPYNNHLRVAAYIAVDKKLKLKFVVNFEPSKYDNGRSDKYLKYCVGYNNGLDEFIKKCMDEVMADNLERERLKKIQKILNG